MYQLFKLIHVVAVMLFLGNTITALFWKLHADRSRDLRIIAHTLLGIIRSDRWFTVPGVFVITAAGVAAGLQIGLPLVRTGWILWSIIAFSLSGVVFGSRVAPLQKQLLKMTSNADPATFDWDRYRARSLQWELWGGLASGLPLLAVAMMVFKKPA
jgi:uncharacterized membrane protein